MATSSVLIMVGVSSKPEASIYVVVDVGECMTNAPYRGSHVLSEPSVYIHSKGL
jgi:hypothetical protein